MLEAYSNNQTVATNGLIPFTSVVLQKGEAEKLSGTTSIQLNRCGVYEVELNVSGIPSTAGNVEIDMTKNNVIQNGSSITIPSALTTVGISGTLSTYVQVQTSNCNKCCSSPTVIQFNNSGVGLGESNFSIKVRRIC